jgi:sulfonate transport system ATP-binding protein
MMGAHDGRIQQRIEVDVPRPRDRRSPQLASLKNEVLTALHNAHVI